MIAIQSEQEDALEWVEWSWLKPKSTLLDTQELNRNRGSMLSADFAI